MVQNDTASRESRSCDRFAYVDSFENLGVILGYQKTVHSQYLLTDEVLFDVKIAGNREFNALVEKPSVSKVNSPYSVKEFDINRVFLTFIDLAL